MAVVGVGLWSAAPAVAQSVDDTIADLCDNNVTFEQDAFDSGFLDDAGLQELDQVTLALQGSEGWFKVVVLGSPAEDGSDEFAGQVLDDLGGDGRVVVLDPTDVSIASTLDPLSEVDAAERAAVQTANAEQSLAAATGAAADVLGVSGEGTPAVPASCAGGGSGGGDDEGGGLGALGWIVIVGLVVLGGLMLFVFLSSRSKRKGGPPSNVAFGEGEQKVRGLVQSASNLVLELDDQVDLPGAPPAAKQAYTEGAAQFGALVDELEDADTRAELEVVYPKLVTCNWKLESAKALLAGQPAPPPPTPGVLFPPIPVPSTPVAPGGPLPPPSLPPPAPAGGGYRGHGSSPWMTAATTAALGVLLSRGMGGGRSRRPPSSDDWFGGMSSGGFAGGGRSSGRRSSGSGRRSGGGGRISMGGSGGRGIGRRRR
jgi:hypothetical protein